MLECVKDRLENDRALPFIFGELPVKETKAYKVR